MSVCIDSILSVLIELSWISDRARFYLQDGTPSRPGKIRLRTEGDGPADLQPG